MKTKVIAFLFFSMAYFSFAQPVVSTGAVVGGGMFSATSASVGGFSTGVFGELNIPMFEEVYPRAGFLFIKDFNAILPNTKKTYHPYIVGIYLKGITSQYFDNRIFLEEGVGITALNDHTFSDSDLWDYGVVLSFSVGVDLRNYELRGFKVGAGVEYAITFFETLPQYTSVHLQCQYLF